MQEYIPFFQAEKRSIAEKLAKYFEYSGVETKIHFDEEKDEYILSVPSKKEKEAKKFYQAFYFVERDRIEKEENNNESIEEFDESKILSETSNDDASTAVEVSTASTEVANEEIASTDMDDLYPNEVSDSSDDSDDDTDADSADDNTPTQEDISLEDTMVDEEAIEDSKDISSDTENNQKSQIKSLLSSSGSYVMKSEKFKDYVGTQYVFLLLGIAGIIFVFLNVIEVFTLLYGLFPNLIMGALFVYFIYVGISTGNKARQLKQEIEEENQLTEKIKEWLRTTVTEEFLTSITNAELSEELDYIKKTDTIRDMLIKEFGEQDHDYLDRLVEEFYTETFDE